MAVRRDSGSGLNGRRRGAARFGQAASLSGSSGSIADGGAANRAVTELLAKALHVPKSHVRVLSGTTSRLKQIAVDGDPKRLGVALSALTESKDS